MRITTALNERHCEAPAGRRSNPELVASGPWIASLSLAMTGQCNDPLASQLRQRLSLMLRTGKEHIESLRDGRVIYIGGERVDDVTRHPAFRNAAQTVAAIYDLKADPANREAMSYEEDGGRHSIYYLRAKSRDDLQRRMIGNRRIADLTYGMFGRSPDHVASFVTGMAMKPDELKAPHSHADNLLAYYPYARA